MGNSRRVGDHVTLVRGKTYKGALVGSPGPALLGLGSITPGGGFRSDYKTYGGDCPPELMLSPGDLFVSLKGATKDGEMIGSIARLPESVPNGRLTQDTVRLVFRERDRDFEKYLYRWLQTPVYRRYCASRATGSAVVALSRDDFLAYPVPPLTAARRNLVAALELIEQKLDLGWQLVEVIPRLIRAHVERNLDQGRSAPVSELARFVNGGAYTKGATDSGRMVLRIAELNSGPSPSTVYNELDVPEDRTARPGDILMSWSGSLGVYRWRLDEAIINQHIFKVIPVGQPAWLVFDRLDAIMPEFRKIAADKATTMGHIQRRHLDDTRVEMPNEAGVRHLDKTLGKLWDRLLLIEREVSGLVDLRLALLEQLGSVEDDGLASEVKA